MGLLGGSRVRSPPVPVVLSVYQRGSLLDGLAMYLSCDTLKAHTYYIIFGRPPIGGKLPPWRRYWLTVHHAVTLTTLRLYRYPVS